MSGLRLMIGRRHFLATAAIGSIGAFLPLSPASAATVPPGPGSTVSEPASDACRSRHDPAETAIIGAAAEQSGDTSIRPFKYHATDAELADLKRRIKATKWPDRETVNDDTQGVRLATMQKLADYWANHHDWRRAEAQIFSYPELRHQHRRARHPLHPREVEAPERAAGDHHPRLARIDHRAVEDHRAADRSDRAWRDRGRRVRRRDPVAPGLWLLGQADRAGMGSCRASPGRGTC